MKDTFENTILNKLFELSTKIDVVSTVVKRHDEVTFPDIQNELKTQSNALMRMESKQNKDILQFVEEKEKIHKRLEPLEEHVSEHKLIKSSSIQARTTIIVALIGALSGIIALFK